ncbi:cell envelope integrity protein TolA [Desulfospira joergensenii]|uniref:cell envelope integrity protein TolA n=1 Tax=Desulfospira joergensenii TaxID=53329 RepID=UPI0003B60A84|nr:topoisomerase DNA-binding C4 zinc finger domain-containing protein [Desulfospira joergensenii]
MGMPEENEMDASHVRKKLDEILAREITAFIDVDTDSAMMSFNLASISCITIIVEREREIKQYSDFPPERYVKESFINELVDIGLEKDDYLDRSFESLVEKGYISRSETEDLKAEMPSFMMAGLLDSMFPGMQGMNLIAFVLQMNDEVNSGRKTLDLAMASFETSLKTRGVAVQKDRAEKLATDMASGAVKAPVQTREISQKLKKENLNRLSQIMKGRRRADEYKERVRVQDVFDKGPTKEEIEAQKEAARKEEEEARKAAELAKQLVEKDEKIKEAEESARKSAEQLKALEEKEAELKLAKEKAALLEEKEALMAEKEAQLRAMEERIRQEEERIRQMEQDKAASGGAGSGPGKDTSLADDDIESRIAEFESDLAMVCPLCSQGEVVTRTTEKGKNYYSCSKPDCRFVSWDMPYHFQCPLCKNPFLTEITTPSGEKGLKCPRAACPYSQNNLLDPKTNVTTPTEQPKKKKRVVRRKKRH